MSSCKAAAVTTRSANLFYRDSKEAYRKFSRNISQLYSPKIFFSDSVPLRHKNVNMASFHDPSCEQCHTEHRTCH